MSFNLFTGKKINQTKVCIKCKKELHLDKFGNDSGGNYKRTVCRKCSRNAHKIIQSLKKSNPYPSIDYVCPICEKNEQQQRSHGNSKHYKIKKSVWCLDHEHDTGKFRGWLCHSCNTGLGLFRDSETNLKNAIKYLNNG